MPSSRTQYRKRREEMVKECIISLMDLLTLSKQELEAVKLPFFKKLKKTIDERRFS